MSSVRIRMHRQGLGDCFLLTFDADGDPVHVLIDCGVLAGTPKSGERMRAVAEAIRDATGGHVHVLIATHEHWDHLSGFLQARDVFDTLTFGEVWLAWTEDPDDDLAKELDKRRKQAAEAVVAAAAALDDDGLHALLRFQGDFAAADRPTTAGALEWVKQRPGARTRLLRPGEQLAGNDAVAGGVRTYVLGPPHDRKLITRSDPSKRHPEVYELAGAAGADHAFYAAADALARDEEPDEQPFVRFYRVPEEEAPAFPGGYLAYDARWRRIEQDWLGVATRLALHLDSDTNNTSLALAFELGPGGDVLLFPGDAQVGNWLSWGALTWIVADDGGPARTVTAHDLLGRTVLYKVGHHASHNATLREEGLERMTSPDLVAMIPVNRETARKQEWNMPFPPLLERLVEKTDGRILDAELGVLGAGAGDRWDRFVHATDVRDRWVGYTIEW